MSANDPDPPKGLDARPALKERLKQLRMHFVATLPSRVAALERVLAEARASDPSMVAAARAELAHLLHTLVGSSGVHGLLALADAARAAEVRLESEGDHALAAAAEWQELHVLFGRMREQPE